VLAGSGGNGGGALVAARRLHGWGARVRVVLSQPTANMTPVPAHQLDILHRLGVEPTVEPTIASMEAEGEPDLIIDGLIGYSLQGAPHGVTRSLIDWANDQHAPTLALDTPSGIDTASGTVYEPAIRAAATLTLALPKVGLRATGARDLVGELYLADISVPPELYAKPPLGLAVGPIFAGGDVVRLREP
jgi:NAD(P)H-hydrate epimerase